MSEDIGDITPSQALVEIEQIRKDYPFAGPTYTKEVDARKRALYVRAYDEPEEGQAPKGRQFPEVQKSRREARQRDPSKEKFTPRPETAAEISRQADSLSPAEGRKLRADFDEWVRGGGGEDADDDDNGGLGSYPIKSYAEKWGSYQPSYHDERQWSKAVRTAAKIGVSPTQLGQLRDALLEDVPIDADDDGGEYSPDDYQPPVAIPDDKSWATFKMARRIAAEHGVSPVAFQAMAAAVMGAAEAIAEPQMRRAQKAAVFDLIHNVGEDNAVRVVQNAQRALEHFRPSGPEIDRLMATPVSGALTLGDHPIMIELLGNVGAAISFDALQKEFRSPNGSYNPRKQRL